MGIAIFIIIIIAAIIYSIWYNQKRTKEWMGFAGRHGFNFSSRDFESLPDRYGNFDLFQQGHSRHASNICHGEVKGIKVCLFDYQYTTGSGKNSQTHYQTVLIANKKILFKPLDIRPENFMDKIGAAIGFDDIDFESAEFSKKFYVKSPDKKFAYDIIHPRMMEFLLKTRNLYIEAEGCEILFHHGRRLSISELEILLLEAEGFYNLIPDYVLQANQISPVS
jgi:hypothetical protein